MNRRWLLALAMAGVSGSAHAQSRGADRSRSITTERIRALVDRLAHDSMMGRDTPSPELDRAAAWVEREFRQAGLSTTVQRYPLVRRRLLPTRSTVSLTGPDGSVVLRFDRDAALAQGRPAAEITGPLDVLAGTVTADQIPADSIRGHPVLWLADFSPAGAGRADGIVAALLKAGPSVVLIAPNAPALVDGMMAQQTAERLMPTEALGLDLTAIAVRESAISAAWPALGGRLAEWRGRPGTALIRSGVTVAAQVADTVVGTASAPNVVGVLRGRSRPGEYVAVSAHLDHLGIAHGVRGDSIFNGADDNASGSAGLLELARAFGQGPRPERSVLFLSVSGEEKGLWGSGWFVAHPTVPLAAIVADVNIDMIGRNWTDTVGVIGREHSDLGQLLDQVAGRHPELRMTPIGDVWPDQGRFYRSDHFNFARHGVPILFLSSGYAPEYHEPTDAPGLIDAEKEARLVRLVYHFTAALANRPARPRWNPDSFRTIATAR